MPGGGTNAPEAIGEGAAPQAPPPARPGGVSRETLIRLVLVVLVLAVAMVGVHYLPVREWLNDSGPLRQMLAGLGIWVYPVSILGIAVLVAAGVPRLLFCTLSGALFGFLPALLINELATVMAYYWVFLFVRWGGRDVVMRRWPKLQRWTALVDKQGIMGVVLVRQLPVHGTLVNLCLGLSHLKHRHFLLGTAIGVIPEAIAMILIGASAKKASLQVSAVYITLAVGVFAALWIGGRYLLKRMKSTREGAALIEEASSLAKDEDEEQK